MLRITISDSPSEQKWLLQGRLTGQWVSALLTAWNGTRDGSDCRRCLVDLNEVTFIDRTGEAAIAEMMSEGAQFVANGLYTKELLKNLRGAEKSNNAANGERRWR